MKWEKCTLSSVITVKKGDYITRKEAIPGPYPVILGGQEPAYYINQYNHSGKAIVISRSGASAGYVSIWNEPIFVTDGFLIEPKENIPFEFLYYLLKSKQTELTGLQRGAAIPHVTPSIINAVEVLLPDLPTQHRIASILSAYDDLIENNRRQIKLLEEAAQRLYREWFVELRFPGHENVKIVDGVPEGWSVNKIQDILTVCYGKDHKKVADGDIPVYGSGGYMRACQRPLFTGQSVLIPRKGSLNNIMYVDESFWTVDTMFYTVMKLPHIAHYVFQFMKTLDFYNMNTGAAVPSTTSETLNNLMIMVPKESILKQFDGIVQDLVSMKTCLEKQIRILTDIRDLLLPKLMSGEMEV